MSLVHHHTLTNEELIRQVDTMAPGHGSLLHTLRERLAGAEDSAIPADEAETLHGELEGLHEELTELLSPLVGAVLAEQHLRTLQELVNRLQRASGG